MIVAIIKNNRIIKTFLPEDISGDYILKDGNNNMLGHIAATDNKWVFYVNKGFQLLNNDAQHILLEDNTQFAVRNIIEDKVMIIYSYPSNITNVSEYRLKKEQFLIGSDPSCDICYTSQFMKPKHAKVSLDNNRWYIESLENGVFVNDRLVKRKRLEHGDVIFIYGLRLVCLSDFVLVMNVVAQNKTQVNSDTFEVRNAQPQNINPDAFLQEGEFEVYEDSDYFLRSPRFRTSFAHQDIKITPPTASQQEAVQPAILTVGPQLTMMLSSVINLFSTLTNIASGAANLANSIPSLLLTVVMMVSSLFWPAVTRKWNKREKKKNELKRIKVYRNYLANKEKEIQEKISNQKQILLENNVTLEQCQQIIYQKKRNLWERTIEDDDFLTARIGVGYVKPDITIQYEEADFRVDDDILVDELKSMIRKFDYVEEAPLNFSFLKNRISAIVGNYGIVQSFFESILLQLMTFHLYSELKIIVFTNESRVNDWNFIKFLPHCWDNQRSTRFIAATIDEKKFVASYLENVIKNRMEVLQPEGKTAEKIDANAYKKFDCYYLIITDDIASCRHLGVINNILSMKENIGFSMIIKNDRIANLPSQCSTFLNITDDISGMFGNQLNAEEQKQFTADLNKTVNVEACAARIANIFVEIPKEKHELPKSVGFMEMYGVGNVDQFNSAERWVSNNPVASLSVPVGIDQNGELFNMDIHEKAYGPHGLVAGTTGSGKSEWIITYILSLAVNFSPLEVQFVLIDYKGGGLAGSFENKETGIRLPHLIGTITNLDKSEIRRSLASLEAESKRRQRMFNEAREKLNDSSMNIYKYQQYYRKGMLDEPLSHLFIISDEFAELKSQEPEFLDQLVSIARIGRSLGIHLILATQKPTGVVDEQMWSNSRFKVCLRVQDKQDSNDMIKCPDAAYLKQTGAFYFQVGLNEFFGLGQSAYAGGKYKPTTIIKKKIETSLDVIDRTGNIIDTAEYIPPVVEDNSKVHGEELLNIIMYLSDIAAKQKLVARKLWLDAIPENIYVDNLKTKYAFTREFFKISPIIGEYDNPYQQLQGLLQVPLNNSNVFICGLSGSGKEKLLQSMLYSIISSYTPQEVGIYICDFGAETLSMFENAPHVGDVVYSQDKVKIENLDRFIKKEINDRRARYRDFGGNYDSYIKYSKVKDPLLVVAINDAEYIKENYVDVFESMESYITDTAKYGIIFVETTIDLNLHRSKTMGAYGTRLALKLNNNEAETIFGTKARDINIKDLKGRGLCEIDDVIYEFQTASICEEDKLQQSIKMICQKLQEFYKYKTPAIPQIPNPINFAVLDPSTININSVVVGYSKLSIAPVYFNLQKNQGTLILANKKQQLRNYTIVLNQELEVVASKGTKVYFFDPEDTLKMQHYQKLTYVESEEIPNTINNLLIYINNEYKKYEALEDKATYKAPSRSLIVFYCASLVYGIATPNVTNLFADAFSKARELMLFDFVILDVINDFREIQRDRSITQMFIESNGVCIGNCADNQMTLELNTRDIRVKDALLDNEGYIIEHGKAKISQILQDEGDTEQ